MSILIVGAGPSGAYLAQLVANKCLLVTLLDRLKNPTNNCFSSAVVPISSITSDLIPYQAISTFWKNWQIFDPNGNKHIWTASENLGVVLDFGDLRNSLWEEAIESGVELIIGSEVKSVVSYDNYVDVTFKDQDKNIKTKKVSWFIDASGNRRQFISDKLSDLGL